MKFFFKTLKQINSLRSFRKLCPNFKKRKQKVFIFEAGAKYNLPNFFSQLIIWSTVEAGYCNCYINKICTTKTKLAVTKDNFVMTNISCVGSWGLQCGTTRGGYGTWNSWLRCFIRRDTARRSTVCSSSRCIPFLVAARSFPDRLFGD